jgi:hypothetical protein
MLVIPATDANYLAILPTVIDDGEQRCYRELDLLNTVVRDTGGTLTASSRNFTLPQTNGRFVVTNNMNVFTPAGSQTNRIQLVPTSRDFLDAVWGNDAPSTSPSVPQYYAPISDQQFIVGPPPDANYTMEVIGTIRPTPLSATNTTSYLSLYLPDLFFAASMIFASAYQLNFNAQGDDPQQATAWELHFQKLLPSANTEEQRKRYASQAWTSMSPASLATPARV